MKKLILLFFFAGLAVCQSGSQEIQSLIKQLDKAYDKQKVDILNRISFVSYRESTPAGTEYANKAFSLAKSIRYSKGEAVALRNIGFGLYLANKTDSAMLVYNKAIDIFNLTQDIKEKAACFNNIGLIFWRKGESIKAFEYYRNARKLSEKTLDSLEIARSLNYIGLVYWKWGDLSLSLDYFTQSLRIKEALDDKFELAVTLNNIANLYNELKEYKESLSYSNRALKISESINDKYGQGRALNNIGVSYYCLKNYEKAKDVQLKSLAVKESSGDKSGIGYSFLSLGNIYFDLKNYSKAIEFYEKSLQIRNQLNDSYGISSVLISLGKTFQKLGNTEKAVEYLNRSLEIAKRQKIKDTEKNNYLCFSSIYEAQGDYQKAYFYYKLYNELEDSLYNKENRDKLAELRINFESEKKEKEIALLTKENELRQYQINKQSQQYNILITVLIFGVMMIAVYFYFQNKRKLLLEERNRDIEKHAEELKELNASKDKFFSIVAHDLKSPFHGILGFLGMLADELDSLSKEQIRRYVNNIRTSTKNVYDLIENLLDWSRIQIGRCEFTPVKLDLREEVEAVRELLANNAVSKGIRILDKVPANVFLDADRKMARSIFQNLLSNAIKFTNPGGEVTISCRNSGENREIIVADTGVGLEPEETGKIFKIDTQFTKTGTAGEKGTGLGLLLCKEMIEKHGGSICVESIINQGTKFIFTLPQYVTDN